MAYRDIPQTHWHFRSKFYGMYVVSTVNQVLNCFYFTWAQLNSQRCDYCLKGGAIITCLVCKQASICTSHEGVPGCLNSPFIATWTCPSCSLARAQIPLVRQFIFFAGHSNKSFLLQYPLPSRAPSSPTIIGVNSDPLVLYSIYNNFQDHIEPSVAVLETLAKTYFIGKVHIHLSDSYRL